MAAASTASRPTVPVSPSCGLSSETSSRGRYRWRTSGGYERRSCSRDDDLVLGPPHASSRLEPSGRTATGGRRKSDKGAIFVRILVAEDETIIRLDLKALLERAGFQVCAEARDGVEAVELARTEKPDLAILDVKMPRLDGIEAAKRILDERPIPIVMLTAYGQEELVSRAVEAGVFGYLVKPFREQDLVPAIATARARHEELQALREEAESLAEALAARRAIERAKGLLMAKEGLTEQQAFERLRRASQISGRPLKVVAEALIATFASEPS
ncbi:MAG: response regulator [Thermoleophilia bacterium]